MHCGRAKLQQQVKLTFDIVAICLLSVHETYNNKDFQAGITFMWVCIVTIRSSDSKGHKIDILGSIRVSATTTWENSEPREACAMGFTGTKIV